MTQISLLLNSKRAPRVISQSFKTPSEKLGTFLPLLTAASESVGLPAAFASGSPISNINTNSEFQNNLLGLPRLSVECGAAGRAGAHLDLSLRDERGFAPGRILGRVQQCRWADSLGRWSWSSLSLNILYGYFIYVVPLKAVKAQPQAARHPTSVSRWGHSTFYALFSQLKVKPSNWLFIGWVVCPCGNMVAPHTRPADSTSQLGHTHSARITHRSTAPSQR